MSRQVSHKALFFFFFFFLLLLLVFLYSSIDLAKLNIFPSLCLNKVFMCKRYVTMLSSFLQVIHEGCFLISFDRSCKNPQLSNFSSMCLYKIFMHKALWNESLNHLYRWALDPLFDIVRLILQNKILFSKKLFDQSCQKIRCQFDLNSWTKTVLATFDLHFNRNHIHTT